MINYLGEKTVSRFTIGTAGSGLALTILEIILAATINSNTTGPIGIILYVAIALVFNFWDLFLNLKLFRSNLYKRKILATLKEGDQLTEQSENPKE